MKQKLAYSVDNDNPAERKRFIRGTFDAISPTYDLLNRILSFGIDMRWRRFSVSIPGDLRGKRVLDTCAGTGDSSAVLTKKGALAVSLDFSLEMLRKGVSTGRVRYPVAADASCLPFRERSFSVVTVSFGIRNIPDINVYIGEVFRVLTAGGDFVILELTRPENPVVKFFYRIYLFGLIPLIGGIISGKFTAYRYLPETIASFVDPEELRGMLEAQGFEQVRVYRKMFGVATVLHGRKAG